MSGIVSSSPNMKSGRILSQPTRTNSIEWTAMDGVTENSFEIVDGGRGINMYRSSTYGGIRLPAKYKYFSMGFDVKCTAGSYFGAFWSNDSPVCLEGAPATGWKTTFNASDTFAIRRTNQNDNQTSFNPGYSPSNGAWHHHQIEYLDSGYAQVHTDGNERLSHSEAAPTYGAYLGLLIYARCEVQYRNFTCFELGQLGDLATG